MTPFVNVLWPAGAPSAFPSREGATSGSTSSLTHDPVLDLTALPLTEGNVLVLSFRDEADDPHGGPSGWTKIGEAVDDVDGNDRMSCWRKTVVADEDATPAFIKQGSSRCGWVCFEYSDAHGDAEAAVGAGFTPPALTPSWGSAATTWVTAASISASDNTLTAPTNYDGQTDGASDTNSGPTRKRTAMAQRENAASSESPGAWSASGTYSKPITATIGVRPA